MHTVSESGTAFAGPAGPSMLPAHVLLMVSAPDTIKKTNVIYEHMISSQSNFEMLLDRYQEVFLDELGTMNTIC
jgi:hypothetical protein